MRTNIKTGLMVLTIALVGLSFTSSSYEGNESSNIVWTGKKVTGQHTGTIDFKSISWKFDETGSLVSADFVVDMASIKNTDLGEDMAAKLEGHLNSPDFFNTTVHPTASFKTSEVKSLGKGEYSITGDLTIKDITNSLTFTSTIADDGHMKHAMATVVIDRAAFDVQYGSGSFFEGLGDKMINDEFTLEIDIKKH